MKLEGLIAATFTPMDEAGQVRLEPIAEIVEGLIAQGVTGLYVCGSTGEGPSLTVDERKAVAEAYVQASAGRIPSVIQVGANALEDARALAAHAASIGADAISAVAPTYFKPADLDALIDCVAAVCEAAPEIPFYYYHIPPITGLHFDMVSFLRSAPERIPSLAGIKFSSRDVDMLQSCLQFEDGKYDILFGVDEMLLSALAVGCTGAVGSTYNFMAPLYRTVMQSYAAGDMADAQAKQYLATSMIRTILEFGGMPSLKTAMNLKGADCGGMRLPLKSMSGESQLLMREMLERQGFLTWANGVWED